MDWWVKALATKTDDLTSIPGIHMVKEKPIPVEYPSISTHTTEAYAYTSPHIYIIK